MHSVPEGVSKSQRTPHEQATQSEAAELLRRAPMAYLWNQIGSIWSFVALFLLTLVVTRSLGKAPFGIYAIALTVYNTALYVAAFGLEDAATVFVPRTLAAMGRAATSSLVRRLLLTRIVGVVAIGAILILVIPPLEHVLLLSRVPILAQIGSAIRIPSLDTLTLPVAAYVAGASLMNILTAIFTAILRTRLTLIVGGLSQVANIAGVLLFVHFGFGVAGVIWALAIVAWVTTAVYLLCMLPLLLHRAPKEQEQRFTPVLQMGWTAWLTNLVSGALLKQSAISLLQYFAIDIVAIGYFSLAFQLSDAAAFLLIAGLGGVGMAAMAASYAGQNKQSLGFAWRAVSKVQILLSVPLLAFVYIHAGAIAVVLYGVDFAAVGPLMQVFLVFTLIQRIAGGGSHQAALYVLGRQRLALWSQWGGLLVTLILGAMLVPQHSNVGGPAGALIAVGVGKVGVELVQLALAWRFLQRRYPLRFGFRVCLALIPAMVLAALWHPSALLLPSHLGPLAVSPMLISLVISVLAFAIVLMIGLAVTKPIEHEDVDLLAQVNPRLRPILSPFASGTPSPIMRSSATPAIQLLSQLPPQTPHSVQ